MSCTKENFDEIFEAMVLQEQFTDFSLYNSRLKSDPGDGPPCGSIWNIIKLEACALGCGIVIGTATLGGGLLFCGWMCWCTFCTINSDLAIILCQTPPGGGDEIE